MISFLAACLLALVPSAARAQTANMIRNPGFEEGQNSPFFWDLGMEGRGAGSATWVTEGRHPGERCVRLELTEPGDYWMARQRFEPGTARPEHPYRISGWYRGFGGGVHVCVYFRDKAGGFLGAWETALPGGLVWLFFDFVFRTKPGTDHFELQLRVQGSPTIAWYGNVSLQDAEELTKQGQQMVAPLLRIAETHPEYVWVIVSNDGSAGFHLLGCPPVEVAWAVANPPAGEADRYGKSRDLLLMPEMVVVNLPEGEAGDYGVYLDVSGMQAPVDIARRPTNADLQTRRLLLPTPTPPLTANLFARTGVSVGPGPILLVGVRADDALARSLIGAWASPRWAGASAWRFPWEAQILESSQARLASLLEGNRGALLRTALAAGGEAARARLFPASLNNTVDQWVERAAGSAAEPEPSPVAIGARNEYLSAQVLYAPPGKPKQVTAEVSDLVGDGGMIPASACQVRMLEYVPVEGTWYPDPLMEEQPFTPPAHGPIVFWLTIHVPEDTKPGFYRGTVTMQADGGPETSRDVSITVWPITLPKETHLHSSFWLFRGQINRYFGLTGDVRMEDYYPYLDLVTSHRLCPVDVVEGPTAPMVKVYREPAGNLSYDFSTWDKYLDRLKAGGANTVHLGFTHWMGGYFADKAPEVMDRKTGQAVGLGHPAYGEAHLVELARYLRAAADHARARGFDFVYIQPFDEPSGEGLATSYKILKGLRDYVPDIPRLMTAVGPDSFEGKMKGVVNLWCPLSPSVEGGAFDKMRDRGDIIWWYVCCGPGKPYANLFTNWRVAEMRALFWQAWQYRITGLLYWGLNYWLGWGTPLPPPEQRFPRGPWRSDTLNGDGYSIYPGPAVNKPLSSIRLETMRSGIQDYELLYLLNSLVQKHPQADRALLARAREALAVRPDVSRNLTEFDRNGQAMEAAREEIAGLIEKLQ